MIECYRLEQEMSSGNKRRFQYYGKPNRAFHSNKYRGGHYFRPLYRWDRPHSPEQSTYLLHQNESMSNNCNVNQSSYNNTSYNNQQSYNCGSPLVSEPPNGLNVTPLVGPGSETDRLNKVMATKRRIEEALASKSSKDTEMTLHDSSSPKDINKDKESDKNLPVTNLDSNRMDLILTNNDFKEIGSVESNILIEGDTEMTDLTQNVTYPSSQRCFENIPPQTTTKTSESNINKSHRIGGWNICPTNDIVTSENTALNCKEITNCTPTRSRGDSNLYINESREKILGNIEIGDGDQIPSSKCSNSNSKQNQKSGFEQIGRLYQSFLKSRLCGYTLKMKHKTKNTNSNPTVDKSVIENCMQRDNQVVLEEESEIELEMPRPIIVKIDNTDMDSDEQISEDVAAKEAKEFCQEYSYLLTHPNYLIPPENLEKLGLGHLNEMSQLINERKDNVNGHGTLSNPDNFLRVRNLNALNDVTDNDIVFVEDSGNSSETMSNLGNTEPSVLPSNSSYLNNSIPIFIPQNSATLGESPLVDVVAEKVLEKLTNSVNVGPQCANPNILPMHNRIESQPDQNESAIARSSSQDNTSSINLQPPQEMRNISSKILRLFLIDKQIEDLIAEKMKIYNELLSVKEVSSSLFNSWAQDQIQNGNVMNIVTNNASTVPNFATVMQPHVSIDAMRVDSFIEKHSALPHESRAYLTENADQTQCCTSENTEPRDIRSCMSQDIEVNKPKLSVRKDLIDPNVNRNLIINDFIPPDAPGSSSVKSKKKKLKTKAQSPTQTKKKKKHLYEVVNLIEDTTDDGTVKGDEPPHAGNSNQQSSLKKKNSLVYNLKGSTATRLTVVKKALVVGCKDGSLWVFNIMTADVDTRCQAHSDAIMCLHTILKNVISGSADSTISVYSFTAKTKIQCIPVIAPIQCCDIQFCKAYFGTKNGYLVVYKVQMVGGQVSLEEDHNPLKLTNCSILAIRVAEEGSQRVIILASRGEQITVREATTGKVLRTFDWCDTVHCIELYNSSPMVYCGTNTKSIKVMNFITGENDSDCHLGRAIVQITFQGSLMFAASFDGKIYVYDVEDKKKICIMPAAKGLIQGMIIHKLKIIVACNQHELISITFPKELKKYFKHKNSNYCAKSQVPS